MMRKLSLSAVAVSMLASVVSAQTGFDGEPLSIKKVSVPEVSQVADRSPKAAQAEWTIMVFGNGKNDLEPFLMKDLNEMEMVGSNAKLNIIVEAGRIDGYDASDGDWKGVRRYRITKDNNTSKVSSKVIKDLGQVDMGDYKSLVDFGKWAKQAYPAKKYMLIVWNHGSGWTKSGKRRITKGISYDEQSGNHINTVQFGQALRELGKVDVIGSDACLMQMAEVDYELKDFVDYIVGSEETEPGDGYTYNTFLGPVAANPAMSPMEVGKQAVNAYSDHYKAQNSGSTQSLVKSAAIPQMLKLVNEFAYAMTQANEKDLAKAARDGAVQFADAKNKDLYDFTRLMVASTKNADVKAKGQALMSFISSDLVLLNRTNNDPGGYWNGPVDYSPAKGIAIYIPSSSLGDGYTDMQWAKYSNWDEFLTWLNS